MTCNVLTTQNRVQFSLQNNPLQGLSADLSAERTGSAIYVAVRQEIAGRGVGKSQGMLYYVLNL